jgi:NAD(P) transhydrogenase subunit beta
VPQNQIIEIAYFAAAVLFILGLKLLSSPRTARGGMHLAELGMAIAIAGTLLDHHIITYTWIAVGAAIGAVAGVIIAV